MIASVEVVPLCDLLPVVQRLSDEGHRLVSITGSDDGDHFDLLYHFDLDLALRHLRLRLPKGEELPSISRIYYCAFVPENELQDFYGIKVAGTVIDYEGHMLLSIDAPKHPMVQEPPREEVAR